MGREKDQNLAMTAILWQEMGVLLIARLNLVGTAKGLVTGQICVLQCVGMAEGQGLKSVMMGMHLVGMVVPLDAESKRAINVLEAAQPVLIYAPSHAGTASCWDLSSAMMLIVRTVMDAATPVGTSRTVDLIAQMALEVSAGERILSALCVGTQRGCLVASMVRSATTGER
jgi:hypothetical protein